MKFLCEKVEVWKFTVFLCHLCLYSTAWIMSFHYYLISSCLKQLNMAVMCNGWMWEVISVVNQTSEQDNLLISNGACPVGLYSSWLGSGAIKLLPFSNSQDLINFRKSHQKKSLFFFCLIGVFLGGTALWGMKMLVSSFWSMSLYVARSQSASPRFWSV